MFKHCINISTNGSFQNFLKYQLKKEIPDNKLHLPTTPALLHNAMSDYSLIVVQALNQSNKTEEFFIGLKA